MKILEEKIIKDNWEEVIFYCKDVLLEDMEIFKDYFVFFECKAGIIQLWVCFWEGEEYYIDFGEDVYLVYMFVNLEFDIKILCIGYMFMIIFNIIYDYDMEGWIFELFKQQEVVGGFNLEEY